MAGTRQASRDDQLVRALACGATNETAARACGVSERTVYRRLKDPKFHERIAAAQLEMRQRAMAMLTAGNIEAARTLIALQQPTVSEKVRLEAARATFECSGKLREELELVSRIDAVEARINATTVSPPKESE